MKSAQNFFSYLAMKSTVVVPLVREAFSGLFRTICCLQKMERMVILADYKALLTLGCSSLFSAHLVNLGVLLTVDFSFLMLSSQKVAYRVLVYYRKHC